MKHGAGKIKKRKLGAGDESIAGDDADECLSAKDNIGQTNGAAADDVEVCLPAEDNIGATKNAAATESEQKKSEMCFSTLQFLEPFECRKVHR